MPEQYEPSMMNPQADAGAPEEYAQEAQAFPEPEYGSPEAGYNDDYGAQDQYSQSNFADTGGGYSDNTIEIAEQVVEEKTKDMQKDIHKLNEFRTLMGSQVTNISERLKRIETTIDQLQLNILNKVGSYTSDIAGIKNEMQMIENSFSKIIKPIVEKKKKKSK